MQLRRLAQVLLAALATSASLTACSGNPDNTGPLPEGQRLVDAAAENLRDLTSVAFELDISGAIPGLPVRKIEGVASRTESPNGTASGDADMQLETERVRYEFALDSDVLRLTDSDGETVEKAMPDTYTPARLLDPEQGMRQLLTEAEGLETETREQLGDVETYRVDGDLSREAISAVVPAVHDDVDVKFWIADGTDQLMRIWIQVPPRKENEGAVQVQLVLTEHNTAEASTASARRS
ncbi:LppX_LprAFG lipoprotein [Saccharomonospora sp.]|uniref:LppX_LprAFG lipoprotein n=1 Tax=Saccharomonospora sp. TaxID=33913 RepID=UPI00262920BD|nr:LppX_LprAFG lipoprotein [Saccharomonospora sp.]